MSSAKTLNVNHRGKGKRLVTEPGHGAEGEAKRSATLDRGTGQANLPGLHLVPENSTSSIETTTESTGLQLSPSLIGGTK